MNRRRRILATNIAESDAEKAAEIDAEKAAENVAKKKNIIGT
jgi:hypothetical protein